MIPMNTARRRALARRRGGDMNAPHYSELDNDSMSFSSLSNASSSPSDECSSLMRHYSEVIQLQSTSVSEEAHEELDHLMDTFNIEDAVKMQTATELTDFRNVMPAPVSADLSRHRDRDKDGDKVEGGGATRKVLQLKQRHRSTSKKRSFSRLKGKAVDAAMLLADDPSTVTNSSQGQKSTYTNATGYTDGTGTTAPHENTLVSKSYKLRWKRRGGKMTGVGEILSVPESISMKGSDEMNSKLMNSARDEDVISPTALILVKRKLAERKTGQPATADVEATSTPFILGFGFVQNLFECCSAIPDDEFDTSMPKYRHYPSEE